MVKTRPTDFYFSPNGKMFELHRERLLILFGGQRALLMQLAHPLVAQGVLDHSSIKKDPLKRLNRTILRHQTLIFGTIEEVTETANKINNIHNKVKGNLTTEIGAHPANTTYHALDPELLTWVWATMTSTGIAVYENFIRPLSDYEKETYYQESKKLLSPLGGKIDKTPPTLKDFEMYFNHMYKSKKVFVNKEVKKEIVPYLFLKKPSIIKLPLYPLSLLLGKITIGLLPVELRDQYGLRWTSLDQKLFNTLTTSSRIIHSPKLSIFIPKKLRYTRQYNKISNSIRIKNK